MRILGFLFLVCLLAGGMAGLTPARADVMASAGAANMCLDVQANPAQVRSPTQLPMLVKLWTCNGGGNQNFFTSVYGPQRYNGLCLDMASQASGAPIVMAPCRGTTSQNWSLVTNFRDPNNGRLRNQNGWCINIPGGNAREGTQPIAYTCQAGYALWNDIWARGPLMKSGSVAAIVAAGVGSRMNNVGTLFTTNKISPNSTPLIGSDSAGVITLSGGSVIAAGGGNVIAAGGGNVITMSAGVIAAGGGNVIAAGGGNLLSPNGGNVVGPGASTLIRRN